MKKFLITCLLAMGVGATAQTYCVPSFASGCSGGDAIDDFVISSAGFTHSGTACSATSYEDFSSTHTITLQPTINYSFSVTHGFPSQQVRVWIDFDNNYDFDPTAELVGSGSSGSLATSTGVITVPATVAPGNYRMRVATRYSTAPIPCETAGWGEAHDYTVTITAAPSCLPPTGVSATTVGSVTAVVEWTPSTSTPTGYQVYYSTVNTAPTATTTLDATNSVSTASSPANLSSLTPATTYYFWVRSDCGAEQSVWESGGSFTTACVPFAAPFTENFSGTGIPNCWSTFSTDNTGYALWLFTGTPDYGTSGNGSAAGQFAWVDASVPYDNIHDVTLQSPQISLTGLASPLLQFRWFKNHLTGVGGTVPAYDHNELIVQVRDVNSATWTEIFASDTNGAGWRTEMVALPASLLNATIELRFIVDKDVSGNGYFYDNVLLDDIQVINTPTCLEPGGFALGTIGSTTADLSWTAPMAGMPIGYTLYYSTSSTPPNASTVLDYTNSVTVTAPALTATIPNLTPVTTYYVWVRTNCGSSDVSTWSPSLTFTTQCAAYVPAYTNDFGTFPGACWSHASGGSASAGPAGTGQYWFADGFLNSGSTGAAKINLYSTGRTGWLMSPVFDLTAGDFDLTFDYGLTLYASTTGGNLGSDDLVQVLMSTDNGATWQVLQTWDTSSSISNTATQYSYTITGGTAQTRFAIYATDGSVGDPEDIEFFVDNFSVLPAALSVVETLTDAKEVKVYPNPFTDVVNISDIKDVKSVTVMDMSGRMVKVITSPARQLHLGDLKSGMYLLKMDYKDGSVKTAKVIKK